MAFCRDNLSCNVFLIHKIYKQVIAPIWILQNKIIRNAANAPWYVRNDMLHRDLNIPHVKDVIRNIAKKHYDRLAAHRNPKAIRLLDYPSHLRRLQRKKPSDLCFNV